MGNLVRSRIITTKVFAVLDETSYFRYYIFSYWHCSFVKRNKKILHLLCIASPANNFHCQNNCDKWGYNWFEKTSSMQVGKWISKFLQKSGEKNVSGLSSKSFRTLFSKDFMYDNVRENEQKFMKQNFETMRQYTLNN